MKILLIDVNCKYGSTGKIVYDIYSHLNACGHEAAVCYGRGRKIKEKNIFKFGLDLETYFHAFMTRLFGFTGCFSYFSTKRLIKYIKKFNPDVVHLHELHAYFINVAQILNYLKKRNIKVIHTLHCSFSYTGKCGLHLDCEKWKSGCGNCPRLKNYVSTMFFDHTKRMYEKKKLAFNGFNNFKITCPSEWLAEYAKQSFLNRYEISVVHNGVNTNVFYPKNVEYLREKYKIENQKIILSVAPHLMNENKGGNWVLKLANHLDKDKFLFFMIGVDNIPNDCPENVIMISKINNQDELADYYSLADVFVLCSFRETFSLTCAESLSCGTPVAGFKCGAPETIFEKPFAVFVEYGDIRALAEAIKYINKQKLFEGISKYSLNFSNETMLKQYELIYKS